MPVVPSTDSPPTMPSRRFIVFSARRSPPGIAIVTVTSGGGAPFASATSASWSRIIARGAGLIAGSPGAQRQAGPRHRADPFAGAKADAASRRGPGQLGDDQRAVRHVGIVAGILDDAGAGLAVRLLGERQRKARRLPAGQADRHGIGETAGQQRRERGPRRRRRAGPGRPAAPQRRRLIACHAAILDGKYGRRTSDRSVVSFRSATDNSGSAGLQRLEPRAGAALDAGGDQPVDVEAVRASFRAPAIPPAAPRRRRRRRRRRSHRRSRADWRAAPA